MNTVTLAAAIPTVTIFVRHKRNCPKAGDNFYKSCRCPKQLRWYKDGKQKTRAAKTRAWVVAEDRRREVEAQFAAADPTKALPSNVKTAKQRPTLEKAIDLYISDKLTQGLDRQAHNKHARELGRFREFMERRHKFFPHEIELSDLTEFRAGWVLLYNSSLTRSKVQERLRGFLRYCSTRG